MRITLIGKPDCHLCHDARAVLTRVCGDLGLAWEEVSILEDPVLYDEFWEKIPVVQVEGRTVDFWTVDEERLRRILSDNRT
ncbi:MAG: glutaredoxin family protein [Candidatus Nanopelagicales bacterium]